MSDFTLSTPEQVTACLSAPASTAELPMGPMQFADVGDGPPLLCVHGGPGGYDQGLILGETFRVNGFRVIGPSRPGYLETPLKTGTTLTEQADALAALLDYLGIERCAVVGVSAAGGAIYELAARHPRKVSALVAVDCVASKYQPPVSDLEMKLFVSTFGFKLTAIMADYLTGATIKGLIAQEGKLDRAQVAERVAHIEADPLKQAYFMAMVHSFGDHAAKRVPGARNDNAQLGAIAALPLERIIAPTLIIHGTADNDVFPSHAEHAHRHIAGSELRWIQDGTHFCFWLSDTAEADRRYAVDWLRHKVTN
ncbi:alpha/beta fold hydrolase [Thiorhodovibrio frisius]|nr:alpha/beta hydrolase [Thiorhodovibrio frisius]